MIAISDACYAIGIGIVSDNISTPFFGLKCFLFLNDEAP